MSGTLSKLRKAGVILLFSAAFVPWAYAAYLGVLSLSPIRTETVIFPRPIASVELERKPGLTKMNVLHGNHSAVIEIKSGMKGMQDEINRLKQLSERKSSNLAEDLHYVWNHDSGHGKMYSAYMRGRTATEFSSPIEMRIFIPESDTEIRFAGPLHMNPMFLSLFSKALFFKKDAKGEGRWTY